MVSNSWGKLSSLRKQGATALRNGHAWGRALVVNGERWRRRGVNWTAGQCGHAPEEFGAEIERPAGRNQFAEHREANRAHLIRASSATACVNHGLGARTFLEKLLQETLQIELTTITSMAELARKKWTQ